MGSLRLRESAHRRGAGSSFHAQRQCPAADAAETAETLTGQLPTPRLCTLPANCNLRDRRSGVPCLGGRNPIEGLLTDPPVAALGKQSIGRASRRLKFQEFQGCLVTSKFFLLESTLAPDAPSTFTVDVKPEHRGQADCNSAKRLPHQLDLGPFGDMRVPLHDRLFDHRRWQTSGRHCACSTGLANWSSAAGCLRRPRIEIGDRSHPTDCR
jgi:hypothetical protein